MLMLGPHQLTLGSEDCTDTRLPELNHVFIGAACVLQAHIAQVHVIVSTQHQQS